MDEYYLEFVRTDRGVSEKETFWVADYKAAEEYARERCRHAAAWKVTHVDRLGAERIVAWDLVGSVKAY